MEHVHKFEPKRHLAAKQAPKVRLMKDLGFGEDAGVSAVAYSEAFQLFTPEAIRIMREEIDKPEVRETCKFSSNIAAAQLRGYAKKYAPFTYEAWNHAETLKMISDIAGIELVPVMDYEIGHINLSTNAKTADEGQVNGAEGSRSNGGNAGMGSSRTDDEDKPIVGWHTDSYPIVCVLMMSDCTGMVGGETAVQSVDGGITKVRGPTQGCAVILQGRYITHQALRAHGGKERITSVTSFRPKSAFIRDDTELRTVRPVSDLSELYYGFAEYRLEILEKRIQAERQKMQARHQAGDAMDTLGHKEFLGEMIRFVEQSDRELVEESKVQKGVI
ncbi:hypothetical protein DM02DRAFT_527362 [Periconia macrospinosa]|uniref:Fe2OG dioxygenase domain-containing protein n=1 Tax=Periconia macrospinosa TaxID=97972 RepID=A0A2V1DSU2_9PLEO|nr:hypothetical protein DM02DRAFT_527362 [Periconia macrospinosa]